MDSTPDARRAPAPSRAERWTVLIADDDARMRTLLSLTLGRGPYSLLDAGDGEAALEAARDHHPDLILLDGEMPKLHGFEVCRQLKADPATRDIRIVMLTAKAQEEDRARGLACGADGYITKPFSPIALLQQLAEQFAA